MNGIPAEAGRLCPGGVKRAPGQANLYCRMKPAVPRDKLNHVDIAQKNWARRLPARPIPPLIKQVLVPVPGMIVISGSNREAEGDGRAVIQRDQVIVGSRRQRPQVEVELPETMCIGQRR